MYLTKYKTNLLKISFIQLNLIINSLIKFYIYTHITITSKLSNNIIHNLLIILISKFFFSFQTFHTPNFNNDFNITPLNSLPISNNISHALPQIQTNYSQHSYPQFISHQYHPYSQHHHTPITNITPLNTTPIFPPQNFNIPNISLTNNFNPLINSLTSITIITNSINNNNPNSSFIQSSITITAPTITNNTTISIIKINDKYIKPNQQTSPNHNSNSISPPKKNNKNNNDNYLPLTQINIQII